MKRIRVPDGMLEAAIETKWPSDGTDSRRWAQQNASEEMKQYLEAALLWLSEHPQVPTDEQVKEIAEACGVPIPDDFLVREGIKKFGKEWQRRCFVEEEPEIPAEIKDLLLDGADFIHGQQAADEANKQVIEAFRRGLTHGSVALRKGEQK